MIGMDLFKTTMPFIFIGLSNIVPAQWVSPSPGMSYMRVSYRPVFQPDGVTAMCAADTPYKNIAVADLPACSQACVMTPNCDEYNYLCGTNHCQLYLKKPTTFRPTSALEGCQHYQKLNTSYYDCSDVFNGGDIQDGVYILFPGNPPRQLTAYCSQGWTVFQTRVDGSENFNLNWDNYVQGFGNWSTEFWLGNEDLYSVLSTAGRSYSLQINMVDFNNQNKIAAYNQFTIDSSANNYTIHVSGYNSTLSTVGGDSFSSYGSSAQLTNNHIFSTSDKNNIPPGGYDCAAMFGGGWWFNQCYAVNLNGNRIPPELTNLAQYSGMAWLAWATPGSNRDTTGFHLSGSVMKIRAL